MPFSSGDRRTKPKKRQAYKLSGHSSMLCPETIGYMLLQRTVCFLFFIAFRRSGAFIDSLISRFRLPSFYTVGILRQNKAAFFHNLRKRSVGDSRSVFSALCGDLL